MFEKRKKEKKIISTLTEEGVETEISGDAATVLALLSALVLTVSEKLDISTYRVLAIVDESTDMLKARRKDRFII